MSSYCRSHVVRRTGFRPPVAEFARADRELGAHICIAKHEDWTILVFTFSNHELEMSVSVLGNAKICDWSCGRVKLRQVAASCLSMKDRDDLHRRLVGLRDGRIA